MTAGEPRSDRKTVPIVGPLCIEENAKRLLSVMDYGLQGKIRSPELILSVAPQAPLWGASAQHRDALSLIRRRLGSHPASDIADIKIACLFSGRPPRYIRESYDEVYCSDSTQFPPALELLIVPGTAVAAVVHAPIGASSGHVTPLGVASFDEEVTKRTQALVADRMGRFIQDHQQYARYYDVLGSQRQYE